MSFNSFNFIALQFCNIKKSELASSHRMIYFHTDVCILVIEITYIQHTILTSEARVGLGVIGVSQQNFKSALVS